MELKKMNAEDRHQLSKARVIHGNNCKHGEKVPVENRKQSFISSLATLSSTEIEKPTIKVPNPGRQ
jgi:hypothetical protein